MKTLIEKERRKMLGTVEREREREILFIQHETHLIDHTHIYIMLKKVKGGENTPLFVV